MGDGGSKPGTAAPGCSEQGPLRGGKGLMSSVILLCSLPSSGMLVHQLTGGDLNGGPCTKPEKSWVVHPVSAGPQAGGGTESQQPAKLSSGKVCVIKITTKPTSPVHNFQSSLEPDYNIHN